MYEEREKRKKRRRFFFQHHINQMKWSENSFLVQSITHWWHVRCMFTCEVDIFQTKIKKKVIFFDFVLAREGWDEDDGKHVKWEMRNERINMECKCHL